MPDAIFAGAASLSFQYGGFVSKTKYVAWWVRYKCTTVRVNTRVMASVRDGGWVNLGLWLGL